MFQYNSYVLTKTEHVSTQYPQTHTDRICFTTIATNSQRQNIVSTHSYILTKNLFQHNGCVLTKTELVSTQWLCTHKDRTCFTTIATLLTKTEHCFNTIATYSQRQNLFQHNGCVLTKTEHVSPQ